MTAQVEQELETETEELTVREAIRQALREELERDEDVFLIGEDIGEFGGVLEVTGDLYQDFDDERIKDTPISEAGFTGAATGAAATGTRPVVELMFSDFTGVAMEQIMNQMAKMRYMFGGKAEMPVTVRTTEGGGMGAASQHSGTVHTWIGHFPGLKAVTPGTAAAAKGLTKAAIRSNDPVFVFENKMIYEQSGPVPTDEEFTIPIGEASVEREGDDVTVVATQRLVGESLQTAEGVADDLGLEVEVIDLQSLYPLDTETLVESVRKTGRLIVADESPLSYGTHAEIVARVQEEAFFSLDAPIQRVGTPDTHMPFSPPLESEVLPGGDDVRAAIERIS
ncbi:alpha-ketoacid dehydrogenase subunit beta [Natronobacterium gregoryi]|uniref:Alpha-ketoacid dehydrogenase subunit beta n=2 Tax=Natronobacterium gregoryi TaxID=44930 RepID=L0AKN9_NATGS|nr:alpha-ketoacid dehydrogenase subunit beta [Natronobacterium gregoryi]AFZ74371.1 pyruvate/2-oxoglutarate dehydrogenase complex, dehydrogenase component beta subunit [Natronobacterium gregoryi SP2]ELY63337.1 transketolase [Natronobacterium gregoryi SP2]PLK22120.1 alpha-ketoacid dehydrogenase subunit beta [Natronobacterium gregoryi SP2]SFI54656.1 pyruvate dehydrogenase E1 component beta subunit [Natronobacterium gregoryi]